MDLTETRSLIDRDPAAAAAAAREALVRDPSDAAAYRLLGASLRRLGQDEDANAAELSAIEASGADPHLIRAGQALQARDFAGAEALVRRFLAAHPNDALALQMLGEIAAAAGLLHDAEARHWQALSLAPGFEYARLHLANILNNRGRPGEALAELRKVTGQIRDFEGFKVLLADVLGQVGEPDEAIALCRDVLAANPNKLDVWSRLAFLLTSVGRPAEAIDSCRSALAISPTSGRAWWALADLKTYRFTEHDIEALQNALADPRSGDEDRLRLHFTLGKALEDGRDHASSFDHYRRGNELRRASIRYDSATDEALPGRIRELFTPEFLNDRADSGEPAPDPIFIVGLPRSGSTLLEQILASHPMIEATGELPDMYALAMSLHRDPRSGPWNLRYLERLATLAPPDLRKLGSLYLERTRIQRKTARPFFVDKMPGNWAHVGMIRLILPNARIIDMRRHPLACGFSNYKQLFGRGQEFSYDLADIGRFYRSYTEVMGHFDGVAPGTVHRVIHEQLVADLEGEVRGVLEYLGLPFDEACLRFQDTGRAIRTPSSQQVRQPLRGDSGEQWKPFDAYLGPLKDALGRALDHWDDPQQQQ